MARKTTKQWQAIFKEHENSGLSVPKYCQKHHINVTTFYNRRAKLALNKQNQIVNTVSAQDKPSDFIQVKPTLTVSQPQAVIILNTCQAQLQLPASVSPQWVGQVLKELAQ